MAPPAEGQTGAEGNQNLKGVERCPLTYQRNRGIVDYHLAHLVPPLLLKLQWGKQERLLDHGCATGDTSFKYLRRYAKKYDSTVYAFDHCTAMLRYAKERFNDSSIKYIYGDLSEESAGLKDLTFHRIFSFYTLHFVSDYKAELKKLYEMLEPGGEMFVLVPLQCLIYDLYRELQDPGKFEEASKVHLVIPDWVGTNLEASEKNFKEGIISVLENEAELEDFVVEEMEYPYENPGAYADMMLALNAYAKSLSEADYLELKDRYHSFFANTETKTHKPHEKSKDTTYILHYYAAYFHVKKA